MKVNAMKERMILMAQEPALRRSMESMRVDSPVDGNESAVERAILMPREVRYQRDFGADTPSDCNKGPWTVKIRRYGSAEIDRADGGNSG
jgi:hypothetical protein